MEAESAALSPLATIEDRSSSAGLVAIGSAWTRDLYDGPFHLMPGEGTATPRVSLVFVQSREGNTGADNPDELGGGPVDKHLIYEGLSRVAADAVLAGAKSVGTKAFFSVWHPQIVALRAVLGLPRHPAQIVASGTGCVDLEQSLLFNVPDLSVFVLAAPGACARLERAASSRPWIELVPVSGQQLRPALEYLLNARRIRRISAIGGRTTASALIDEGLVQDLYLTTTGVSAGQPNTPFYVGRQPPAFEPIVRKRGTDSNYPITFEHLLVRGPA
jgi:riboflavin biosynthesis pyrimidine reductase